MSVNRDRIRRHQEVMTFIKHRERVLDMESRVKREMKRSTSAPPPRRNQDWRKNEAQKKVDRENERLLKKLVKITVRPSQYTERK